MSSTRITNKLLLNGTLNHCKNLARLNLSRTRLSNKRLSHLVLPLLSQLNLDWTRVTSDCRTLLTGKLYITCVKVQSRFYPLTPVPPVTSLGLCSTSDVITFDQNWRNVHSTSAGGKDLSSDTQIIVIGSKKKLQKPKSLKRRSLSRQTPNFDFCACPSKNVTKRKVEKKACCHVSNAF